MADRPRPERGVELLAGLALQCEAMVLGGDRDPAGGVVHHRDVDATVPEHHLVGRPAQRPAEDLVAEADAEQRDSRDEDLRVTADHVVGGGGVAGAVGQEDPVGLQVGDLVERADDGNTWLRIRGRRNCAECWS